MESVLEESNSPLHYDAPTRNYLIPYPGAKKKNHITITESLHYCPWCGKKLPRDLIEEWIDIIEEKFSITDPLDKKQIEQLPDEFKTDQWWKKKNII